jgi:hypothetical protein
MAKSKDNVVMHGASGIIGDLLLFSQRYGKTIIGKIPKRGGDPSPDQQAARERFLAAIRFAKRAMADPEIKKLYEPRAEGDNKPFNLAVADFLKPPVVADIIVDTYTGAVGSLLQLLVTDDTVVKTVEVTITAANGTLLEQGVALQDQAEPNSPIWIYTATALNNPVAGSKVTVVAKDLPGNTVTSERVL